MSYSFEKFSEEKDFQEILFSQKQIQLDKKVTKY